MKTYLNKVTNKIEYMSDNAENPNKMIYVEIDENIAPIIGLLNAKGYDTNYSCEGHYYEHAIMGYVSFEPWIYLSDFPQFESNIFEFDYEFNCIRFHNILDSENHPFIYDDECTGILEFNKFKLTIIEWLLKYVRGLDHYHLTKTQIGIKRFYQDTKSIYNPIFIDQLVDTTIISRSKDKKYKKEIFLKKYDSKKKEDKELLRLLHYVNETIKDVLAKLMYKMKIDPEDLSSMYVTFVHNCLMMIENSHDVYQKTKGNSLETYYEWLEYYIEAKLYNSSYFD